MEEGQQDKIVHLVLTRFNLAVRFECKKRFDSTVPDECPWLDEEWMEKRFAIFEKYTFASLKNQTNKDFVWLVMFHKETPEKYREKIKRLQKAMPQFLPLFFTSEESVNMAGMIKEYIIKNYKGCPVITTRIDNDDLVHKTFIEMIREQRNCRGQEGMKFLSYVNGLQYDDRNRQILSFNYPNNHFLTLFTDAATSGNHVLQYNHAFIENEDIEKIYEKTEVPLWVEVIHENNVSNALHWRFSTIKVPYLIHDEYSSLDLQWNSKIQWFFSLVSGVWKVFWNRGRGLCRILKGQV